MKKDVIEYMVQLFRKGVHSVQMPQLIRKNIIYNKDTDVLKIFGEHHYLKSRELYVVGAGKAVYHMAKEMEVILGSRIKCGIVSVPFGIVDNKEEPFGTIKFYEGAKNNLPDNEAECTTKKIMELVTKLDSKSLLIVLLSGGGSALLSSPLPPITLQEKYDVIKNLASAGADIIELNTVRKRISNVKGGKLSMLAYPAEVITLLLSDIVLNHASFIASGPTFPDEEPSTKALEIVKKYHIYESLPISIKNALNYAEEKPVPSDIIVSNYMLGNNIVALESIKNEAEKNIDLFPIVISACVHGDVNQLSFQYGVLIENIISLHINSISSEYALEKIKALDLISVSDNFLNSIDFMKSEKNICLIAGGEPTVKIEGTGKGGRSQHLALKLSHELYLRELKNEKLKEIDIQILCAGTDGMDGPTDAAGAIGFSQLRSKATEQNLSVEKFLKNNDSYNFYQSFCGGMYHIKTGHTNTNVMDVHIILIKF